MTRLEHPIWEEELMPYVDGQLDVVQASRINEHLNTCAECARVVGDARLLSRHLTGWATEHPSEQVRRQVLSELRVQTEIRQKATPRAWWRRERVWIYGLGGAVAASMLAFVIVTPSLRSAGYRLMPEATPPSTPLEQATLESKLSEFELQNSLQREKGSPEVAEKAQSSAQVLSEVAPGPMIVRSVRLNVVTKDFDGGRSKIENIVRQYQGYLDQLTVHGETGSGRTLSATLRLPSNRIDSGLSDLRKLGKVQDESQNSAEVTSQYVDLQARLGNARNTEQRLLNLLKERTGNLPDVVSVEKEISRVREEIERMEAQQKDMNNKVQFATVDVELSEEYHAQIEPSTPGAGTRLSNASIDGYHAAVETLLGMALFVLRYGPALLLWATVLGPIALLVRRLYRTRAG